MTNKLVKAGAAIRRMKTRENLHEEGLALLRQMTPEEYIKQRHAIVAKFSSLKPSERYELAAKIIGGGAHNMVFELYYQQNWSNGSDEDSVKFDLIWDLLHQELESISRIAATYIAAQISRVLCEEAEPAS